VPETRIRNVHAVSAPSAPNRVATRRLSGIDGFGQELAKSKILPRIDKSILVRKWPYEAIL